MIKKLLQQNIEQKACIFLAILLLGVFASYVYFVSASIVHVVIRTELNQEIQEVSSEISTLESEFIAAQHNVSERIATLEGYTENSNKVFIDRTQPSLVVNRE